MKLFDATTGRLERSLDVRLVRHNVLAGNVANVDTPGYAPKDIDFQATMLHLLGIDHERLTFRFQGRDFRLTDVHGHVVRPILA